MQTWIGLLLIALGYLSGSVNYAILVTRVVAGVDIRTLGNRNPGTANVGRNVGKGWAAVVFFLDLFKGLGPVLLSAQLLHPASSPCKNAVLAAVGMAAILGHKKPLFFGFKGGGAIATSIGVLAYFVPVEVMIALTLGFVLAMSFFRRARHVLGQWTPILFLTTLPFLTLAVNAWLDVPLFGGVSLGGHPWEVPVIVLAIALFILALNASFMAEQLGRPDR
ncbi:MAG: glycerol-3-phosphate acyltransferase [Anaerolineae bacterium]|nr:glycerol-3-phosphate acyltransferase [Anaerolineae bacterium]